MFEGVGSDSNDEDFLVFAGFGSVDSLREKGNFPFCS